MPNSQYGEGSGRLLPRRIIPLVGAMLASVALLAAGASSASAASVGLFIGGAKSEEPAKQPKFEAEKYTATITPTPLSSFKFTAQAGSVGCAELGLWGSISGATSELTFEPTLWPCVFAGWTTSLTANGCQFKLHVLNAGPPYVGTTDIVCPAGKSFEFHGSGGGMKKCSLQLPPQTGIEGVSYENTGAGSARAITVNFNLTTVKYNQLPGTGLGKCTAGEFTNGQLVASVSLAASK